MDRETSSRVSSIASNILQREPAQGIASPEANVSAYNSLLADAKILAGSCLSQDETTGQEPIDFIGRLKHERAQLSDRLDKLTNFIASEGFRKLAQVQKELLEAQRIHMGEYLHVLDTRLADLGISQRSADTAENSNAG